MFLRVSFLFILFHIFHSYSGILSPENTKKISSSISHCRENIQKNLRRQEIVEVVDYIASKLYFTISELVGNTDISREGCCEILKILSEHKVVEAQDCLNTYKNLRFPPQSKCVESSSLGNDAINKIAPEENKTNKKINSLKKFIESGNLVEIDGSQYIKFEDKKTGQNYYYRVNKEIVLLVDGKKCFSLDTSIRYLISNKNNDFDGSNKEESSFQQEDEIPKQGPDEITTEGRNNSYGFVWEDDRYSEETFSLPAHDVDMSFFQGDDELSKMVRSDFCKQENNNVSALHVEDLTFKLGNNFPTKNNYSKFAFKSIPHK